MCLNIVTHTLVCDVRPVMPHPLTPSTIVIDPFTAPQGTCCDFTSAPSDPSRCPVHGCCEVAVRSFPCDCGSIVEYHRYERAAPSSETTTQSAPGPRQEVWREIQSLDEVLTGSAKDYPLASEEVRIARRGMRFRGADLGPKARELTSAVSNRDLQEQKLKNGCPLGPEFKEACERVNCLEMEALQHRFKAACERVDRLEVEARQLRADYFAWKCAKEGLENQ
ncbi:Uu.00g131380.m01.CDS01, partial [Anthostomella pinea]